MMSLWYFNIKYDNISYNISYNIKKKLTLQSLLVKMCIIKQWKCHFQKLLLRNRSLGSKAVLIQLGKFLIFFDWMLKHNELAISLLNHFTQCFCHSLLMFLADELFLFHWDYRKYEKTFSSFPNQFYWSTSSYTPNG